MVQQCIDYTANGLVPIQAYIRQLQQLLIDQDWDRDYSKSEVTQRELIHVLDYQEKTGSMYYPMF